MTSIKKHTLNDISTADKDSRNRTTNIQEDDGQQKCMQKTEKTKMKNAKTSKLKQARMVL